MGVVLGLEVVSPRHSVCIHAGAKMALLLLACPELASASRGPERGVRGRDLNETLLLVIALFLHGAFAWDVLTVDGYDNSVFIEESRLSLGWSITDEVISLEFRFLTAERASVGFAGPGGDLLASDVFDSCSNIVAEMEVDCSDSL